MISAPPLRPRHRALVTLLLCLTITFRPAHANAGSQFVAASGFTEDVVFAGLPLTTAVAFAPDNRIFLALKEGIVLVAQNGALNSTPFVNVSAEVNNYNDRGLLGLAVHPQFPLKPYLYLFYTYDPPGKTADASSPRASRLMRFTADAAFNYNRAVSGSGLLLLGTNSTAANLAASVPPENTSLPEPASCMSGLTMDGTPVEDCLPSDAAAHTVGTLVFAPDRTLFVSHGDGASYDTATRLALRALMPESLAGKVLHINPDTGAGLSNNPYFDPEQPFSNLSRFWSMGMRNPFRIALHPVTGQPVIGDVGSSKWEEVNTGKGANFGWPCYEGGVASGREGGNTTNLISLSFSTFSRTKDFCAALYVQGQSAVQRALFSYQHPFDAQGHDLGAAITGLAYYTGTTYPARYHGSLFIADYALQTIRYLSFDSNGYPTVNDFAAESGTGLRPVQLIAGPDSNIYAVYLNFNTLSSEVRRFRYTGGQNTLPLVVANATPTAGPIPLTVSFRSDGTLDPDGQTLSLRWDFGDGTSSTAANPTHQYSTVGSYTATLTATETSSPFASASSAITIKAGANPPQAFITSPPAGTRYRIGDTISFAGYAVLDGNPLPAANLLWSVLLHHVDHEHLVLEAEGSSGSFKTTEHADDVAYEICLTAKSADQLTDIQCLPLEPQTAEYTFSSTPLGATITYVDESTDVVTPYVAHPVVNSSQTIVAAPIFAGRSFANWTDGTASAQRTFTVGAAPATFVARYANLPPVAVPSASATTVGAPAAVTFYAGQSYDPEGELLSYNWSFSDLPAVAGENVKRYYSVPGIYTATLTATDKLGASAAAQLQITVSKASKNLVPLIDLVTPQAITFGGPAALSAVVYDDGLPKNTLTYRWSKVRGPGTLTFSSPTQRLTNAVFSIGGTYLIKFEASDSSLRATTNTLVTLNPASTPQFVESFSLINADTNQPLPGYEQVANGAVVKLSLLPVPRINLRANTIPPAVGSVRFMRDAAALSIDNAAPYAIKPDINGDFPAWSVAKGNYLLTAVPYSAVSGKGQQGGARSILIRFD